MSTPSSTGMSGNGGGSGGGPNNKPATSSNNRRRRGGNKNKGGGGNAGGRGNGPAPTATNGGRGGGGKPRNRKPKNKSDPNDPPSQTQTQQQQAPSSQPSKKSKRRKAKRNNANQPPTEEQKRLAAQQAALDAERAAEEARRAVEKQRYDSRRNAITTLESTVAGTCATLLALVDTTDQRAVCRESLAEENLNEARKAFVAKKPKLKSDLKKCTAFCKKIKTSVGFDATLVKSLRKDVETLNLTRYIEEICNALVEAKLKVVDVAGVVQVCVALHLRYKDFRDLFLPRLLDLVTGGAEEAKQKRIYFRVLTEMYIVGMLEDVKPVMKIIVEASGAPSGSLSLLDSEPMESGSGGGGGGSNGQYNVQDPNIIVSFIKTAGHEIIGITPKSIRHDLNFLREEIKKTEDLNRQAKDKSTKKVESTEKDVSEEVSATVKVEHGEEKACAPSLVKVEVQELPPLKLSSALVEKANDTIEKLNDTMQQRAAPKDICSRFRSHLQGTFKSLCASYVSTNKRMVKLEKRCEQDRLLAGSLTEQREKGLLDGRKLLESLRKSVEALAEALNTSVPVLEEEDEEIEDSNEGTGLELYKEEERDANLGPFDDEETRAFYCDIPDLLTTIPPALLGYSLEEVERIQAENVEKYGSGFDLVGEGEGEDSTVAMTDEQDPEEASTSPTRVEEDKEVLIGKETDDDDAVKDTPHFKLTSLLDEELPECNRRDEIDALAEKFCVNHGASKNSRKRLEKALFLVPRSRSDLLPYYSRLAAIFDRVFHDISSPLVTELEQQFHGLARWKKQVSLDNRIRNARFIGELTKFRVAPPIVVLRCIRRCLDDFTGYNIDIACCILESCGRYLRRTKITAPKLAGLMDTMLRIKKAKNLDERSVALINSAFCMVQPPQSNVRKDVKVLPPVEAYLKDLLVVRLVDESKVVSFVSKQIIRLPWSDPKSACGPLVVKYLLKACRKGRYKATGAVAALVSNLKKSKPEILARIVDIVLEELQSAMENPSLRDQQRTVVYSKLMGELHARALISASMVFDQLYRFINFSHDIPESLHVVSAEHNVKNTEHNSLLGGGSLGISQTINEDEEMEETSVDNENVEASEDEAKVIAPVAVSMHSKYDPRVPSPLDPPNAVLRIKLVCTLLDSCVDTFVTLSNYSKLDKFLAALQRYMFTKLTLPTDIEFSILDTFDLLESKLKSLEKDKKKSLTITHYETWLEAHNVTVPFEELEASAGEKIHRRLLTQAGISNVFHVDDDPDDHTMPFDDDGDDSVDDQVSLNTNDDDSVDGSENSSLDSYQSDEDATDEEDEESEIESDDEEDGDEDLSDEEIDEAAAHEAYMRKLEDEAFDHQLRRLTIDAIEKGKNTARTSANTKVSDTMPSASQFSRKKPSGINEDETQPGKISNFSLGGSNGVSFKMLKRGHKGRVEEMSLVVPSETNLAKNVSKQDDEAARERDMLKERVLRYEAESAEQMYSDVYLDQARLPEVRNRPLLMEDIDRNFGGSNYRNRTHSSSSRARGGRGGGRLFDTRRGHYGS